MNPYWGANFFSFFPIFFSRMAKFLTGSISVSDLASDEIQVLVLGCVAIASTIVGTLLVLKKMTMLANSLSHTVLIGIVAAYVLIMGQGGIQIGMSPSILLLGALISGILTTVLSQFSSRVLKLQEDASIGLVFTSLFALGIILVTLLTRNSHVGLEVIMGNADALHFDDLKLISFVMLVNVAMIVLFYKEWKLICFDEGLATSLGFRPSLFNYFLMFLTSLTAIASFRAVGVLLFLAFIVGPPLIARQLSKKFAPCLFLGAVIAIAAPMMGVALARHMLTVYQMPLSTSGMTITCIGGFFLLSSFLKFGHNRFDETNQHSRKYRLNRKECPEDYPAPPGHLPGHSPCSKIVD